jgi:tRNA nucleotidyltransferase (CCA-adding enzyme)
VVGGSLRDALLGREAADWDLTTDATPERIQELFPHSLYENRFGTVVVRQAGRQYEITAFRRDVSYSDFRHPDAVEFGESIEEDLARRDFTVNAMAWVLDPALSPPLSTRTAVGMTLRSGFFERSVSPIAGSARTPSG